MNAQEKMLNQEYYIAWDKELTERAIWTKR